VRGGQANGGGSWDRVTLATFALRLLGESSPAATASVNPSLSLLRGQALVWIA
jgi:hypothetical protein